MQELYVAKTASDPEKLDSGLRQRVAYPAQMSETRNGNTRINCGHNPFLLARLVEGLTVREGEEDEGIEHLAWTELD